MIINNKDETEGNFEKLLTKLNKSLFDFIAREYYSQKINIFKALKLLSKIIHTSSDYKLQTKSASLLFSILSNKSILLTDPKQEKISPIINDMKNILLRKSNYPIIIENAIYLIQTGNVDKAISTLQVFSNQNSFINCGEILFYKALIEYFLNSEKNKEDTNIFIVNLNKSLCLIKTNPEPYYHWAIDFLVENKMYKEIKDYFLKNGYMIDFLRQKKNENKSKFINLILKTNLGKENNEFYYESNNNISNQFLGIYKINNNNSYNYDQSNDEETDIKQKIKNFSEFLTIYPFNFNIIIQIYDLIENFFSDDVIISKKNIDLNKYKLFIEKILFFGEDIFINYLLFIMNYFTFNYYNPDINNESYIKLKEILENINYIVNNVDNKCLLKNEENYEIFKENIIDFYKNIIFEFLKKKITKVIKKYIILERKKKSKIKDIKNIKDLIKNFFEIVNLCKEIITGEKLIKIDNEFDSFLLTKDFIIYIQNLN
jgi:hypothetical protein